MILNLLHRPNYSGAVPGDMFLLQQNIAHELQLKVTLLLQLADLENEAAINDARRYAREYGDELGIWFTEVRCREFAERIGGDEPVPVWLYSKQDKEKIYEMGIHKFRAAFGCDPVSVGAYHLDAVSISILKQLCPAIKIAVAGCFEEGVKVFHGCNNSWYLFNEGMHWGPWYPSRDNSLRPAENEGEWAGLVAVPHLSRDLALSYEGRNDFFASHPANVQRAQANVGTDHPYDYNLTDLYRYQEDFNDGFSYYHVFVGAGWLSNSPNIQDPDEVTQKLYRDLLEYFVELRQQGKLIDLYMGEFADWYRSNVPVGKPQVYLAKEVLYGSGKHYFWYIDPFCRVVVDAHLGGSIGDLRPYAGKLARFTGPDSPAMAYATYPYLIQSQYRSGISHHFSEGARTTLWARHGDERIDLATCQTRVVDVWHDGTGYHARLSPARLVFKSGLIVEIVTAFHFAGQGRIIIQRSLTSMSDPQAELIIQESLRAGYGTIEYAEDMHGIQLSVDGDQSQQFEYLYHSRTVHSQRARTVSASVPQLNTGVCLESMNKTALSGAVSDGHLFAPYFTLTLDYLLTPGKDTCTCLRLFPLQ